MNWALKESLARLIDKDSGGADFIKVKREKILWRAKELKALSPLSQRTVLSIPAMSGEAHPLGVDFIPEQTEA